MSQPGPRSDWYNGGYAWIDAVLGYPLVWQVHIPTASNRYDSIAVDSLDEAIQRTTALQMPVEIYDSTYGFMVEQGFAPAQRPAGVASGGSETSWSWFDRLIPTYRKAKGLLGLGESAALALAQERGLHVRAVHPRDMVTEDFSPDRANLYIERGIVAKIDLG